MKQLFPKTFLDPRPFFNEKSFYLLVVLLCCDLIFIVLHLLLKFGFLSEEKFDIGLDGGFGEYFQYAKFCFIIVLLVFSTFKSNQKIFMGWLVLFIYMLLDDALSIHENGGDILVEALHIQPMLGMRPVDLAEIIISGSFGLLFLSIIVIAYPTANRTAKHTSVLLFILLLALAFCGIVIDTLHSIIYHGLGAHLWVSGSFTLIEDGGEQIIVSLMSALVLSLAIKYQSVPLLKSERKEVLKEVNPIY